MRRILLIFSLLYCSLAWGQVSSLTEGNRLTVTRNGEEFQRLLLEDIANARESIELVYYMLKPDRVGKAVRAALIQKAREGVRVRMVIDNLTAPFTPVTFYTPFLDAGIDVGFVHDYDEMGPFDAVRGVMGMRDHRKIVVIDNRIAYTGGMNLCKEAIYDWIDTQVRVEGPAAASFLSTSADTAASAPAGSGPIKMQVVTSDASGSMENLYLEALKSAKKYFYIQTPYFSPPASILQALKETAARGVDVRILLPERCDWGFMNALSRSYFEELLQAGIVITLYKGVYNHSKVFMSDGQLTCVGTLNLDKRSFHINKEVVLLVHDPAVTEEFTKYYLGLGTVSYEVKPGESVARGIHKPYRAFLRALDPLF